jgi:cyclophilin family peptidyl-prolyl cis-trans isomerase/HEAT repeat protein
MRAVAPWLVVCAALAGCSAAPDPVTPGPERAAVTLDAAGVRATAELLRLEDQRRWDAALFERLGEGAEEVRRRAAVAAGRIGDPAAVGFLTGLLRRDASPAVRADAAFALGALGDTSRAAVSALRDAVPAGWIPVRGPETTVVVEVVHALGKLGTREARALVVDALRTAHRRPGEFARRIAAEALLSVWRFDDGPGRVNAVARYADVPDAALRWRAAYALMRLGEPAGAPTLLGLLDDVDHRARANAARGLRPAVVDSAGIRDTALVALTAAVDDEHPHVRINAVRTLTAYGDDAPVDVLVARLDDPDAHVAQAAAEALGAFPGPAAEALQRALEDAARPYAVRAAAGASLADTRSEAVRAAVRRWAGGEFTARYAAARTLPALGWELGAALIRDLAGDADRRVAVAALGAAGQLAADTAAPAQHRAALRALLDGHATGTAPRRATVALRGLASLVDSTELARLRDAREPPAPDVDRPAVDDRALAFYEEIVRTYVVPALAGTRPRAVIRTAGGEVVVELLAEEAPLTVHNFVTLARVGYWNGGVWHRVIPNFVLQDGAPAGDPSGGPGWSIRDEINRVRYARGVLGMALSGPDTGGSQWFITHSPQHHLDGGYTVFGRVTDGMDVADAVLQGDPIEAISVPR